jgi:hypothetical protein
MVSLLITVAVLIIFAIFLIHGLVGGLSRQIVAAVEIGLMVCAILLCSVLGSAIFFNGDELSRTGKNMSGWFTSIGDTIPGSDAYVTNEEGLKEALDGLGFLSGTVSSVSTTMYKTFSRKAVTDTITVGQVVSISLGLLVLQGVMFLVFLALIITAGIFMRRWARRKEVFNPSHELWNKLIGGAVAVVLAYVCVSVILGLVGYIAGSDSSLHETLSSNFFYSKNFIGNMIFPS